MTMFYRNDNDDDHDDDDDDDDDGCDMMRMGVRKRSRRLETRQDDNLFPSQNVLSSD